ncbi:MAG TPA: tetratricopeptide repeat protein [Rariglobus sp.]
MSLRTLLALSLTFAVSIPAARAVDAPEDVAPLVSAGESPALPGGELRSFVAARRALELGFPSVAAGLYTQLLGSLHTTGAERNVLVLELVTARLDEGRADEAERALQAYTGAPTPAYRVRAGLIAVRRKRIDAAKSELAASRPEDLSAGDRAWWYFLQGEVADATGDFSKARDAYERAGEQAVSDMQRAQFVLARERARLSLGEATESQLNGLRQNAEKYQGKTVGYAYARQYAAVLAARGRTAEAVDFLSKQLQSLPSGERAARDDFRLLMGLTAGAQRAEGRNALEGLLTSADDATLRRVALQLLARDAADPAFYAKLNGLIEDSPPSPILADLLLVRAQLGLAEKRVLVLDKAGAQDVLVVTANQSQAELDAKALLAKFPGSELKPAALGLLADLAWARLSYRTAADYAAQARAELRAGDIRASLGVLVAEAYFRAKEYASADEAYAAALNEVPAGVSPGLLIAQRVVSEILAERIDEAAKLLDGYATDGRLDIVQRWQAEWTLARALQGAGRDAEAYARINRILAGSGGAEGTLAPALRARMAWLQARLSLEADTPRKTLELADALPALMTGLDADLRAEVEAGTRLLQAKARFRLGEPEEALKTLASLRVDFPKADAAVYSYIDEADYYAGKGLFVDAQKRLIDLADKFKQHSYAPYALYRAALNVEQRGQDDYYEEAYRILERLVHDYPTSDLVFYARLKQGDLARRLNDFPRARLTYEFLINTYSPAQYPGVLSAELALAACHRAQITPNDVSHYESALTILERLQDLPIASVDLRLEAGFQLGDLLVTNGKTPENLTRAESVWWTLVTTYLLDDAQAAKLGPKGRYWLARTLLRFGDLRRERGNLEEARNAYELVLRKDLPFAKLANDLFTRAGGKPRP